MSQVAGEIAPNNTTGNTRAYDTDYYVYTYTFASKDLTSALERGEKIEISYKTRANEKKLPVTTFKDSDKNGKIMYLPRIGEYNYQQYAINSSENPRGPYISSTGTQVMDMNLLLHDVGFTGKRDGMSRCYIPVLDEAGNVTSYVPKQTVTTDETGAEQKTDRLYWDDTKQPRYEFLDRSTVQIPGNKAISNNNSGSLGDHGVSGRFFDFDMQTGQRQSVVVDAETPAAASAEQTQELRYWRLISSNTHHDCDSVSYTHLSDPSVHNSYRLPSDSYCQRGNP